MVVKKGSYLPNFFDAFTSDQRRGFLRAEIVYDNYLAILRFHFLGFIL
jgi:hypothetical protein